MPPTRLLFSALVVSVVCVVCASCPRARGATTDALDLALAAVGVTRESAHIDPMMQRAYEQDEHRLSFFDRLMFRPFDVPYRMAHVKASYVKERESLHGLLMAADSYIDARVRRGKYWNPLWEVDEAAEALKARREGGERDAPNLLFDQLARVYEETGAPLEASTAARLREECARVEPRVRLALARLIHASLSARRFCELAFEDARRWLPDDLDVELTKQFRPRDPVEAHRAARTFEGPTPQEWKATRAVDLKYLCAGALDVALAIDKAVAEFDDAPPTAPLDLSLATPLGRIEAHTTTRGQTYDAPGHYWLILDFAGDDVYRAGGGTRAFDYPVGVILDFAGDDVYATDSQRGGLFGGAMYGCGFLWDGAGDDLYDAAFITQGGAWNGVGMLLDRAGNDRYRAGGHAQGSAGCGVGVLCDGGGNDRYEAVVLAQGCGLTRGHGALLDFAGDDAYTLADPDRRFPSAQNGAESNSVGQGAGQGTRADLADGHSLAGGFGLLIDAAGDDVYRAGLFAQGVGYWYGVGALLDDAGNDRYSGVWYNMGAAAHFAVGVLIDLGGDDVYDQKQHMTMGAGHDFSVGLLVDAAGNDSYEAGGLAMGAANANGWGLLLDLAGDDRYRTRSARAHEAFGVHRGLETGTSREDLLNLGMLLDLGGRDAYEGEPRRPLGNDRLHVQERRFPQHDLDSERAVFLDGEYSTGVLRLAPVTGAGPESAKR